MNKTITRRRFVGLSVATGATILAGGRIMGSTVRAGLALIAPGTATNPVFKIGGDLAVNRLGFGAMRLTGEGIWGWPPDRANAVKVLKSEIERARKVLPIVSIQNRYNINDRKWEKELDYCERENLGFLPWFPVGGGRGVKSTTLDAVAKAHNASVYQVALAWLLQRSPVMLPIPGTSNIQHLDDNVAAEKLKLTPEEFSRLSGQTK